MKKLFIILFVVAFFVLSGLSFADQDHSTPSCTKDKVEKKADPTAEALQMKALLKCPTKGKMEACLSCHISPTFKLKEQDPQRLYDYPNFATKIMEHGGKKYAHFLLTTVESSDVSAFFDYIKWHPELEHHVIIEIFSPGGSLFDAWRIIGMFQLWQERGWIVETRVHGWCASAGFIVAVSGTKGYRFVSKSAEMMWHQLWIFEQWKVSTPSGAKDDAEVLQHLQDTASTFLEERSSLTAEEWQIKVERKEFWCNGEQALEYGLSDGYPK